MAGKSHLGPPHFPSIRPAGGRFPPEVIDNETDKHDDDDDNEGQRDSGKGQTCSRRLTIAVRALTLASAQLQGLCREQARRGCRCVKWVRRLRPLVNLSLVQLSTLFDLFGDCRKHFEYRRTSQSCMPRLDQIQGLAQRASPAFVILLRNLNRSVRGRCDRSGMVSQGSNDVHRLNNLLPGYPGTPRACRQVGDVKIEADLKRLVCTTSVLSVRYLALRRSQHATTHETREERAPEEQRNRQGQMRPFIGSRFTVWRLERLSSSLFSQKSPL